MDAVAVLHSPPAPGSVGEASRVPADLAAVPVIERLELHVAGAGGGERWDWRSPTLAETKANQRLRQLFHRARGDVLRLLLRAWWSTGPQPTREEAWEHAEVAVEVPSRKSPELIDLLAAGLFRQADDPGAPPERAQAAWRDAERLLGRRCDEDAARRHVARCLKPTIRQDRGFVPPPAVAARSAPAEAVEATALPPPSFRSPVQILGVRIAGLQAPWSRHRADGLRGGRALDPTREAVEHIRDAVPFGTTRRLHVELVLQGHRVFGFPLRHGGGMRLLPLAESASRYCRQAGRNGLEPSHRRTLAHLAACLEGRAGLGDLAPDAEAMDPRPRQGSCPCGRAVPLRRALVAGFPVLVPAAHAPAPQSRKAAWTGLCSQLDRVYADLDPSVPRGLDQPLPDRSSYCLDRDDWWMGIRQAVPPELGPPGPLERRR